MYKKIFKFKKYLPLKKLKEEEEKIFAPQRASGQRNKVDITCLEFLLMLTAETAHCPSGCTTVPT